MADVLERAGPELGAAKPRRRVWPARVGLAGATALLLVWAWWTEYPLLKGVGPLLGHGAVAGLIEALLVFVALVLLLLPLRRLHDAKLRYYLPVLFLVAFAANVGFGRKAQFEREQEAVAAAELRVALQAAMEDRPFDPVVHARGEAGRVATVLKAYWIGERADRQAYDAKLLATGVAELGRPDRLAADPGLRRSAETVARARAALAEYKARDVQRRAQLVRAIDAVPMREAKRRELRALYVDGPRAKIVDDFAARESAIIEANGELVAQLQRAQGRWGVEGGQLMFYDPATYKAFDQRVKKLRAAVDAQHAASEAVTKRAQQKLDRAAPPQAAGAAQQPPG